MIYYFIYYTNKISNKINININNEMILFKLIILSPFCLPSQLKR